MGHLSLYYYLSPGSDLKALCSEAVLKALRRVYPQVYESEHALVIDTKNVSIYETISYFWSTFQLKIQL